MTGPLHGDESAQSPEAGDPFRGASGTSGTATLTPAGRRAWPGDAVETDLPNDARVHDALLGGDYNFHADRVFAGQLAAAVPDLVADLYAERYFLDRAIRCCAAAGVRQFLDLGCGMPTVGNVRADVGHAAADARVLCVDLDPVVVELLTRALYGDGRAAIVQADLRLPDGILDHPTTRALLNLDQPVAVVAVSVLHLLDQTREVVHRILRRLAPGSFLIASHLTADACRNGIAALTALAPATGIGWAARTRADVAGLFTGLTLVRPGVVYARRWRPDPDADHIPNPRKGFVLAGVGRTPPTGVRLRQPIRPAMPRRPAR